MTEILLYSDEMFPLFQISLLSTDLPHWQLQMLVKKPAILQ